MRSSPQVLRAWRRLKSVLRVVAVVVMKFAYWAPFRATRYFRAAVFDSAKPSTLLVAAQGPEHFIVSSSDLVIGRTTFFSGAYDFDKLDKALGLLDEGFQRKLLIDIGANIGTICIPAVKRGLFANAIAIEPEPLNYTLLLANIALNGLGASIATHNVALGKSPDETVELELSGANFGDHRVRVPGTGGEARRKILSVSATTLDTLIDVIDPRGTLVWLDTQGYEGFALTGAVQMLRGAPPLVVEFCPKSMRRSDTFELLKAAIAKAGYTRFHDLSSDDPPAPASSAALDACFRRLDAAGGFTDLLFL